MLNEEQKHMLENNRIRAGVVELKHAPYFSANELTQLINIIDSLESQGTLLKRLLDDSRGVYEFWINKKCFLISKVESGYEFQEHRWDADKTFFPSYPKLASFLEQQLKQTNE